MNQSNCNCPVVSTTKAQNGHGSYGLYENLQQTNDPRQTASNFIDWCISNGTLPLFYQFASHENYYKLIYDYNVYDCVTEEYAPQQAVTNTYPTMVDGQVQSGDVTEGGFDTEYLKGTVDKQMAFMNAYNENRDADLEKLAENMEEGNYSLFSERVSNKELAKMDETALYIKNTDMANYIGMIFNGTKTEETRGSRTLDAFIGKPFYVTDGMYVYGSVVLGEPHKYTEADFRELENQRKHRVPKGDKYDIKPGGIKWAYPIESHKKFAKPKKLSDSTEYKYSFQAREILYDDKANLSKSEYDRLAKMKPIKVSDQEMALIRTQRKTEYSSLDENDIPIIDFFRIGDYRIVNNGFLYYIRNSGPDNFTVVMRKQIVPDVRRITREVVKDENRSNDARTDQSAGQERGKRGLDRSGGDRTGNGRELSENDGGNVQSGEPQRDLHTGQGDADSRTLKLRRIHDLSERIKALEKKLKSDRFTRAKKNEYRRELRKVREEVRELISGRKDSTKMSDRDTTYLDAVLRGDMETAQRMVDEAARLAGYIPVTRYHQTAKHFTQFSTDHPVAGLLDSETPNGIFFKTNDHDIGLGGAIQMALYLKADKMLHFADRKEANAWYRKNIPGYNALQQELDKALKPFLEKLNDIEEQEFDTSKSDEEVDALFEEEERVIEEMRKVEDSYRAELRKLLDQYFLHGESGYDGIELDYDGHRWVNGKREDVHTYIVFKPSQAKSAEPVTYDDSGNIIPLSERFNAEKDDIRYQDRTEDSVSNRSLLANALEGAAKTDIERAKLQEYRDRAAKLDEREKKLRELNAQIKELSFAKGPRDTKKISALRDEAIKTANRIAIHDKKLLQLEAASPLQSILKRERDKAYRRAEAKGAKALEDYKASILARQQETVKKHREMADAIKAVSADTVMMEKEFVRLVKEYEKQEARSAKKVDAGKTTITDLKQKLAAEVKKHKADQAMWEKEFNRLVREYDRSGRSIAALEQKIFKYIITIARW